MLAENPHSGAGRSGLSIALWAAGLAALAGFVSVYVTVGGPDNAVRPSAEAPASTKPAELPSAPGSNRLSQGHMAAFVFRKASGELPEAKFLDAAGRELTLADWRGKTVLLNLWATWCLPCRKEMPALDRLQAEMGSDQFQVVAVSVDRTGLAVARKFLDEAKVAKLAVYADPTARMATMLRAAGLPATLLIDRQGHEVGRLLGPAEWDSEDAKRLIREVMK